MSTGPRLDVWQAVVPLERFWEADPFGSFQCPIPEHAGNARIVDPNEDGSKEPRLLCCTGRWRSLGEIWGCQAYGRDAHLKNIEIAVWTRRLLWDLGLWLPPPVVLPRLQEPATRSLIAAYEGFSLLVRLRRGDYEPRPVPFAIRFAAAWCSISEWEAREATDSLLKRGIICVAERQGRLRLYAPGARVPRNGRPE